jgi:glycosyltransferase involved in cell wall biosynthesis
MKLSILHLIRSLNVAKGGPIEFLKLICESHARAGVNVKVLTLDGSSVTWWSNPAVPVIACGPGAGNYGYHPQFKKKLFQELASFDLMIVHGLWQYHGLCALAVAKKLHKPYYVFPHGMLDPWFKRVFPIKHWKKQLYWLLAERSVLKHASGVLFTADLEQELGAATFWPPTSWQGEILPLGVRQALEDTAAPRREFLNRFPDLQGKRFLLFLGRLHPKKGCDLVIRAMAQLSPPIELVVTGPDSTPIYSEQLRKLARNVPVTFTGMLEGGLKWGALACADALILPSHQENFGLVVAEGMSVGLPVLISNQVNTAELIEKYGAGIVEPDTLDGTCRLIQRFLAADRRAMSLAAKRCFRDQFDIRRTSEKLLQILVHND